MRMSNLRDLFVSELRDLYSAEQQILKALPKMARAASSDELREGFEEHRQQTEDQVERLERIFSRLEEKPTGKKCVGLEGIIKEGAELLKEDAEPEVLDAGLIAAAQRVEHYEMAGYGTVRNYARLLGEEEAAELLEQTLEEEKETDQKLTDLAEQINVSAQEEEEEMDEDEEEETSARGNGRSNGRQRSGSRSSSRKSSSRSKRQPARSR